ncbi:MAG: hypothetical protein AB7S50_11950 [Bacteroidales bacterium]
MVFGIGEADLNIGIAYGVGTYGTKNHNATLGVGYGYYGNGLMETLVFTFCGMSRLSKRISFISENWFGTVIFQEEIPPDFIGS